MRLFWQKSKEIDRFANILADELYSQLPLHMLEKQNKNTDKKLARRFDKELHNIVTQLQTFKSVYKLGVYGKARFHLTFMERLRKHGYPEMFVKEINEYLLVNVP